MGWKGREDRKRRRCKRWSNKRVSISLFLATLVSLGEKKNHRNLFSSEGNGLWHIIFVFLFLSPAFYISTFFP